MNSTNIKISLLVFMGITISIITGCASSDEELPYYTISKEFKDYCWFDDGSYWIFQNDSTLVTDSVKIDEVIEDTRYDLEQEDFSYQAFDMYIKSNIFGIKRYELTAGDYRASPGKMNSLLRLYKDDGSYQLVFSPQYPIGHDIIMGDKIGVYTNVELMETFALNGNTYNDIFHTRVIISVDTAIEYNYWTAKNYSLIKWVSTSNGKTTSISLRNANLIAP
ncbi:MAG: hypothetical protein H8E34_12040 [Bacteroidetes bacterium]|nr:hypothetical protein [Bacteroidota bacterium]MBL6943707.1 hypothetical protein [Bacteroidales bacterium]